MILVTGGTGLLGAQLLFDLASSGKKVRALRRPSSLDTVLDMVFEGAMEMKKSIEWMEGDVLNVEDVAESLQDVDEVYHCAAKVSFHRSDYRAMMKVNVEGTANMVNVALETGVKRFCHVSSIASLGRAEENKTMDEKAVWKSSANNSMYAVSKYGGERETWRAIEEGLHAVVVNPSIIIGPGDWKTGSSAMFRQVWTGMKFYSEGVNGFVDVRDVSSGMRALVEKKISGERFIISAANCTYHEIFDAIADSFHKPRPTIEVGGFLSEFGWRAEGLRSLLMRKVPFITKETARNSQRKWFYTNEKIRKATGIEFIPIEKSIRDCANVFLRHYASQTAPAAESLV
jgi:dihydroflavonol-4-reductase